MGHFAIKPFSSRYLRWMAGNIATGFYPKLQRKMPMYRDVLPLMQAGEVVGGFEREQALRLSAAESAFAAQTQEGVPLRVKRSVSLVRLKEVTVLGNTGAIVDERARRLLVPRGARAFATYHDFRAEQTFAVRRLPANYFSMVGPHAGHRHLYHFLIDRLPLLFHLLENFPAGKEPVIVLTNDDLPIFQDHIYGFIARRYPNVRFETVSRFQRWQLPALYCVDSYQPYPGSAMPVDHSVMDADVAGWLRTLILEGYGIRPGPERFRLYISRRDASKRRILNELELKPALERSGLQPVALAQIPFREQVRLLAHASLICGPHGAGLTNMLFAPAGAQIVEAFPANKLIGSYLMLAKSLGHRHTALIGSAGNRHERFSLDPAALEAELARFPAGPHDVTSEEFLIGPRRSSELDAGAVRRAV